MRLPIRLQREIARLHYYCPAQSDRAIARATRLSPRTVGKLRSALKNCQRSWEDLSRLEDTEWCRELGTNNRSIAQRKDAPDWNWIHQEMQRPDATLEQLWREWRETCPHGIGYSRFATGYRQWAKKLHIVMRRTHRPGEKLFVDFAGRTVEIRDRNGGASFFAQIFVAVLGYSNKTYVCAVRTQSTPDWIQCHIDCFAALGGVSEWVVSDNLKAAVLRRERGRIILNPVYRELLEHYDTALQPAAPRKPKHKSKAEVGVQIAQRWVLFALRDRVFFSLKELNQELENLSLALNERSFKKMAGSRQQRFLDVEQAALKPLPERAFELCDWRYGVRVGDDYHVEHFRCFYSVPYQYRRERVDLRFTSTMLEIIYRNRRIAIHPLLAEGEVSTVPEHQPIAHVRVLEGEPKALLSWAHSVGPGTEKMISHHLESREDFANGLRAAKRMRNLADAYGSQRFEEACAYALALNITALRSIESILKKSPDKTTKSRTVARTLTHEHLRGGSYYGGSQS